MVCCFCLDFCFLFFFFLCIFPLCLTICGHAVRHSGPMRPRVVQEWDWPGERDWEAAAPSSCQTPEVRKLIPGREIFIQKQPKNTSSKQKAEGERARVLETGVPLQFPRPGRFKSELFCSRTGTDAYGPLGAVLLPTTSVRFQQLRFNATTLQNGASPLVFPCLGPGL